MPKVTPEEHERLVVKRLAKWLQRTWANGDTWLSIATKISECIPDSDGSVDKSVTEMLLNDLEDRHAID